VRLTCFQLGTTFSVLLTWQEPCFIPLAPSERGIVRLERVQCEAMSGAIEMISFLYNTRGLFFGLFFCGEVNLPPSGESSACAARCLPNYYLTYSISTFDFYHLPMAAFGFANPF
jgi:hypothetical protein